MRITLTNLTTPTARRPVAALAVGVALALVLTACGNSNNSTAAPSPTSPAAGSSTGQAIAATHNDADVTFINDMAPHHSGAIAMAQLAAGQAGSPQVKDLANRISGAQAPEINKMRAMATAWKVTLNTDAGAMTGMGGSSSGDDVGALKPLTGRSFDKEFLTRMTAHHTSAVQMAQTEIAKGSNPQAKELAASIVAAQQKEIAEMAGLLTSA